MLKPSTAASKKALSEATGRFTEALPGSPGQAYLDSRGIGPRTVERLRLGYVSLEDPPEGWERHAGRIAIPYINAKGEVVWIKFRATPELGPDVDKYSQEPGGGTRLYNTQALSAPGDILVLCEGEFDVITMTALGIPSVGIPGVKNWKTYHHRCLQGWSRIVQFADDDEAGRNLAKRVKAEIPDLIIASPPGGHNDVNEAYVAGLGDRLVVLARGEEYESDEVEPESESQNLNGIASPDGAIPY